MVAEGVALVPVAVVDLRVMWGLLGRSIGGRMFWGSKLVRRDFSWMPTSLQPRLQLQP
jgi:hypothetical protein